MASQTQSFINLVKHPIKFRLYLLSKLPSAFFSGVRPREIDSEKCIVTVPHKWFSQNPFRSTYFACLSMAAEMSSGLLALAHSYKSKPEMSMLVVKMESSYFKKATGVTTFICADGELIRQTIEKALATGEGYSIVVKSTVKNSIGETVAEFFITWSFKARAARVGS